VYSRRALRDALGISVQTLKSWIRSGKIPPPTLVISDKKQYWCARLIDDLLAGKGASDAT
jgi:predicted site-specific integrase-resolvase